MCASKIVCRAKNAIALFCDYFYLAIIFQNSVRDNSADILRSDSKESAKISSLFVERDNKCHILKNTHVKETETDRERVRVKKKKDRWKNYNYAFKNFMLAFSEFFFFARALSAVQRDICLAKSSLIITSDNNRANARAFDAFYVRVYMTRDPGRPVYYCEMISIIVDCF